MLPGRIAEKLLVTAIGRFWGVLNQAETYPENLLCVKMSSCEFPSQRTGPIGHRSLMNDNAKLDFEQLGRHCPKRVCAIVFDTFGTIVDWRGSLINSLQKFGLEAGPGGAVGEGR